MSMEHRILGNLISLESGWMVEHSREPGISMRKVVLEAEPLIGEGVHNAVEDVDSMSSQAMCKV